MSNLTREEIEAGLASNPDPDGCTCKLCRALRELAAIKDAVDAERMSGEDFERIGFETVGDDPMDSVAVYREARRARLSESALRARLAAYEQRGEPEYGEPLDDTIKIPMEKYGLARAIACMNFCAGIPDVALKARE